MLRPVISVIIPCYNQAHYLTQCLQSVISQKYRNWQAIVIDDASTVGDIPAVLAQLRDDRIRLCRHDVNRGLSEARNSGIRSCDGDYLLFLDADDYLDPDMLSLMCQAIEDQPEISAFCCGIHSVTNTGEFIDSASPSRIPADLFHYLLMGNPWAVHSVIVHKKSVDEIGLFDSQLKSCEDWDLWLRLADHGHKFVTVPDAYVYYRRYNTSMSRSYQTMFNAGKSVIMKAQSYHGDCHICRQLTRISIRKFRNACIDFILVPPLNNYLQQHAYGEYCKRILQVFRQEPVSSPGIIYRQMLSLFEIFLNKCRNSPAEKPR